MSTEAWKTVRFGDVVRAVRETEHDPLAKGITRYVGLADLDTDSIQLKRWGEIADGETTFTRLFRKGQMLFGRRRAYQRKAAVAPFDGICSGDIIVMETKPDKLLPELLPFLIHTDGFFNYAIQTSAGSLSPRTKWSHLAKYEFALPPLDEQRRIVEVLTAVEDSIEQHKNLFTESLIFKRVLLNTLFPRPGCTNSKEGIVRLSDVCEMQEGRVFPSRHYQDTGIKLLRPGNLGKDGYLDWKDEITRHLPTSYLIQYSEYLVRPGDIVTNLTAQSLEDGFMGRVCKAGNDDDCLLNQRLGRFKCKSTIIPDYLYRYLQTSYFRSRADRYCEGSKIKHLYWRHLKDFQIVLPDLQTQHELTAKIEAADQQLTLLQAHIVETIRLKNKLVEDLLP